MTNQTTLWGVLEDFVPRRRWVSTKEIFSIVESHLVMDVEDLKLHASRTPQWKVNVRRLLLNKKKAGRIQARPNS